MIGREVSSTNLPLYRWENWYSLSKEFSKQEYESGQPFPSLGDLSNPGIESRYSVSQADSLQSEPPGKPP